MFVVARCDCALWLRAVDMSLWLRVVAVDVFVVLCLSIVSL